jgi:hypothetical protein
MAVCKDHRLSCCPNLDSPTNRLGSSSSSRQCALPTQAGRDKQRGPCPVLQCGAVEGAKPGPLDRRGTFLRRQGQLQGPRGGVRPGRCGHSRSVQVTGDAEALRRPTGHMNPCLPFHIPHQHMHTASLTRMTADRECNHHSPESDPAGYLTRLVSVRGWLLSTGELCWCM